MRLFTGLDSQKYYNNENYFKCILQLLELLDVCTCTAYLGGIVC